MFLARQMLCTSKLIYGILFTQTRNGTPTTRVSTNFYMADIERRIGKRCSGHMKIVVGLEKDGSEKTYGNNNKPDIEYKHLSKQPVHVVQFVSTLQSPPKDMFKLPVVPIPGLRSLLLALHGMMALFCVLLPCA